MRAPSQLRLESADAFIVGSPHGLTIGGVLYPRGQSVPGDIARGWATFRSLIGVAWLIPVKDTASTPKPTRVRLRRK